MDPTIIENTNIIYKKRIWPLICIIPLFFSQIFYSQISHPQIDRPQVSFRQFFMFQVDSSASIRLKRYFKKIKKIRKLFLKGIKIIKIKIKFCTNPNEIDLIDNLKHCDFLSNVTTLTQKKIFLT